MDFKSTPIVFGAKIGTCITAMLAAVGKPREATRAALIHAAYNFLGAVIWVYFIDLLAAAAIAVSPAYEGLSASERLAAEAPRQVANAATLWATANVVLFLPFAAWSRLHSGRASGNHGAAGERGGARV